MSRTGTQDVLCSSSNAIRLKVLPAGDENELSDLSDDDMALDDTNCFEVFATYLEEIRPKACHKQQILIQDSDNSIDTEDVPLPFLRN